MVTIDRAALRANLARLREALGPAELWAVVKADAYGHGALTVGATALEEGAAALCVATVGEGVHLRAAFPSARIVVLSPSFEHEHRAAREARLELTVADGPLPVGIPLHVKVDTGMGRWGLRDAVGHEPRRRRADEPPRLRRCRPGVHRAPDRAVRGDRRRPPGPDAASRKQRGHPALPVGAFRCGAARDRSLRALTVRFRPGRRRARAGPRVAERRRAGEAAAARGEHRLPAEVRRDRADLDRDRPGRVRGRMAARPHRHRGARRRRAAARRRDRVDGLVRRRARTARRGRERP